MILVLVFCITFSLCDVLCRAIRLIFELVIAFLLIDVTSRLRCCIVFAVVVALFVCACTDQRYRRNGFIVILHACFLVDGGISVAHIFIVSVVFRQPFFFFTIILRHRAFSPVYSEVVGLEYYSISF